MRVAINRPPESKVWSRLELVLLIVVGAALGSVLAAELLPRWLPGLTASLLGPTPKGYWYLARAAGAVAYLLLWLSIALGLVTSNRLAALWPGGPTAVDLHQFTSLLALGATL